MDPSEFLQRLSADLGSVSPDEQIEYLQHVREIMASSETGLMQMDGGSGKTFGYLIPALFAAVEKGLPVVVATSTVDTRNQIVTDYEQIMQFARKIDHPIARVPLGTYRSARDYCSIEHIDALLTRHRQIGAPASVIAELETVRVAAEIYPLVDDVMPAPIMVGETIHINRNDVAMALTDPPNEAMLSERAALLSMMEGPSLVLLTHAMLCRLRRLRLKFRNSEVAAVIVDECDRLLSLDFLSSVNITLSEIEHVITLLTEHELDTRAALSAFDVLRQAIDNIRTVYPNAEHVMLHRDRLPDTVCDSLFDCLDAMLGQLEQLSSEYIVPPIADIVAELAERQFLYQLDDLIGDLLLFQEQFKPDHLTEVFMADTDTRLFASWEGNDAGLHVVTISPGRSLRWLFATGVPIVLTTAILATEPRKFALDIGLRRDFHPASTHVRMRDYGAMRFTYITGLPNAIEDRHVSPSFIQEAASEIIAHYRDGMHMLVLTPAYNDIELLYDAMLETTIPLHRQQRGGNFAVLCDRFMAEPGILLTVMWEGYNLIRPLPSGQRGVIDCLVLLRLPFAYPQPMQAIGVTSIYGDQAVGWLWSRRTAEVIRRTHKGFCRPIRGPHDRCEVIIMDNRFPPSTALLRENPLLQVKPRHGALAQAIPARFAHQASNFRWKRHETD